MLSNTCPYELLLHIADGSDVFCSQENESSNVLLNAAASRGFSMHYLSLSPLCLLPVTVLKELSLQHSIIYDSTTDYSTASWK